jgi:protein-disulfide isomerase
LKEVAVLAFRLMPLFAAVCLALPLSAPRAQPAGPADPQTSGAAFTPEQRAAIVRIVREALTSDPSILRDAVAALRADENRKQEEEARAAIDKTRPALFGAPDDPIAGNPQGEVTLVEFYDLHCPYCRRMLPVTQALVAADPKLRIVYKDIPILGPGSVLGARAVLAAQRQDGYLKLQGAIMAGSPEITEASLHEAADTVGLDWARLRRDMDDPAIQARIDANVALSRSLGVQGTPAYVVGGTLFSGAMSLDQLKAAIAAAHARG